MKKAIVIILTLFTSVDVQAQGQLSLSEVLQQVGTTHPEARRFEAEMRSQNEAAKGAYAWMPPEIGAGLWMTPYNPKYINGKDGMGGMGQYMVSVQQMFPNRKRQSAEAAYMEAMSDVTRERRAATLNELFADAKRNFYQLLVIHKKIDVLNENEKLIDLMLKTTEIRYKNGVGEITSYYKAKAALGEIHNRVLMLQNEILQRKIALNTLMSRNRLAKFEIDSTVDIKDYTAATLDTSSLIASRSDIRAVEREININNLQQSLERAKLKPEFGIRFDHMAGIGSMPNQFSLMGMVRLPLARWSARGPKANIESLRWRREALNLERENIVNNLVGETYAMAAEIETKRKQIRVYENEIIPALKRNYQTVQLAYEQNTTELFVLYDAWENLNMTQLEYLDQLQQLLVLQAELERILEIKE